MNSRTRLTVVAIALVMIVLLGATPALAKSKDKNKNGIPDTWEKKYRLSLKVNQAKKDFDKDGLRNIDEYRCATNPRVADTDKDGIRDGQEDRDRDGLVNLAEIKYKTNPAVADSNRDGVVDGNEDVDSDGLGSAEEFALGSDPFEADTDGDGVYDGDEISGFATGFDPVAGILTITSLVDSDRVYVLQLNEDTILSWADILDLETEPTSSDIKSGVMVNKVDGELQDDGTWLAQVIRLMPAATSGTSIATIRLFDDVEGRLTLVAAGFKSCEYDVFVDESTRYAWASGVVSDHDASPLDLLEGTSVTAINVAYTPEGELLAQTIVLLPN